MPFTPLAWENIPEAYSVSHYFYKPLTLRLWKVSSMKPWSPRLREIACRRWHNYISFLLIEKKLQISCSKQKITSNFCSSNIKNTTAFCLQINPTQVQINLCQIQINLCQIQINLCQIQINPCQIQINLYQIQINLCQVQINLCQIQINLYQIQMNLCQIQINPF